MVINKEYFNDVAVVKEQFTDVEDFWKQASC